MCGISGVLLYPKQRTEEELAFIRELSSQLAVEIMARGTDATGIAIFNKEKGKEVVLKHNTQADEMTAYDAWNDTLEKYINNKTTNILIHTRAATKGSETVNDNNHPIVSATTIGIHNGMLWNDDDLFETENLFRQAEVDSEVIFRLADKLPLALTKEHIQKGIAEKISGVFAVAMVKKQDPYKMHYFRNNNPTTFAFIPELNILVFASLEQYVRTAVDTTNAVIVCSHRYAVDRDEVIYMTPPENIIMQFNVEDNTPIEQMFQETLGFEDNYDFGYGGYYAYQGWDDEGYYLGGNKKKDTNKAENSENVYDFVYAIEERLSSEEFDTIISLVDEVELDAWNKGYRKGRESTESDMKLREEKAFREGYEAAMKALNKEAN